MKPHTALFHAFGKLAPQREDIEDPAEVLRIAAEIVELHREQREQRAMYAPTGACSAILQSTSRHDAAMEAAYFFRTYCAPEYWPVWWWGNPSNCSDEEHHARILGLLFVAEMIDLERSE